MSIVLAGWEGCISELLQEQCLAPTHRPAPAPAFPGLPGWRRVRLCKCHLPQKGRHGHPQKLQGSGFVSECLHGEKVSQNVCRTVGLLSVRLLEEALMESRSELKGGKRPWISLGTQRGLKALVPILLFLFPFFFFFFLTVLFDG